MQLALSQSDKRLRIETVHARFGFFQRWKFLHPFGFALLVFQRWELQIPDFFSAKLQIRQNRGDVIGNLKKALAKDAKAAYNANKDLWETVDVFGPEHLSLEALNANKKFNDAIKNCIKLTD
ncbi:MAG: hypothetical protein IJT89_07120 [Bacteroidaceae bacterium]|nr:hypothetical protein [Bacteroidaceae bacterium]